VLSDAMRAKSKQFALPICSGQNSDKSPKISAKTDARIKARKT
jgi:hypothetical protein